MLGDCHARLEEHEAWRRAAGARIETARDALARAVAAHVAS
jgi:hypothetical protein